MRPEAKLIARLTAVFGEPRSDEPESFVAEFERAIHGYDAEVLAKVGDEIIATTVPNDRGWVIWPLPGVVRKIADRLSAAKFKPKYQPTEDRPPITQEQSARAEELMTEFRKAVERLNVTPTNDAKPWREASKPAFDRMQRESPNRKLHCNLTDLSKRMTGERD